MSEKKFEKIHHLFEKYHQVLIETHKLFPFLLFEYHDHEINVQEIKISTEESILDENHHSQKMYMKIVSEHS
jgi:hypothetical protein